MGLIGNVEIVIGGDTHHQILDYIRVPFRCVWCHAYMHVI
jgi:hypothetical protein